MKEFFTAEDAEIAEDFLVSSQRSLRPLQFIKILVILKRESHPAQLVMMCAKGQIVPINTRLRAIEFMMSSLRND